MLESRLKDKNNDKIDILIDMSGYSNQTRLSLFKQKVSEVNGDF